MASGKYIVDFMRAPRPMSRRKTGPQNALHFQAWYLLPPLQGALETARLTRQILERLEAVPLPPGYRYDVAGEFEQREESFGGVGTAALIALFGIFAVLVLEFGSFRSEKVTCSRQRASFEIDGGIDSTTAPDVVAAGARILVAGNAIFGTPDPEAATRDLRALANGALTRAAASSR